MSNDDLTKEMTSSAEKQNDLFSVGDWFYWKCEFEKAREHFQSILMQPDLTAFDLARCYKSLGAIEVEFKNYDEALDIYNKQLNVLQNICDSNSKNEDITSCYLSIGKVYWLKSEYDQAIAYHHRALAYAQSYQASSNRISSVYKNLANIFTDTKEFIVALEYFRKALVIDNEQHPKNYLQLAQTYANIAAMYESKRNYQKALNCFATARENLIQALPPGHVAIRNINKTIREMEFRTHLTPETNIDIDLLTNTQLNTASNPSDILTQNNIMVLWLDDYIGQDDNCRALKAEFRQITNSLKVVDSVRSCRECLPYVKDRKVFCIIQGKYAKEIVPDIVQIISPSIKPVVYIFCLHMSYLVEWAEGQECVMEGGMFDHEKDLFDRLSKDLNDYVKQKSAEHENKQAEEMNAKYFIQIAQISIRCCHTKNAIEPSQESIDERSQGTSTVPQ